MSFQSKTKQPQARRYYSQDDEDIILEGVFAKLGVTRGTCVDVGAHDGIHLSNTAHLIRNHGWSGVLIECGTERFKTLRANTRDLARVRAVCALVAFSGENALDAILDRAGCPAKFEMLSIDVDGMDYHIWESLARHQPTVVVIEYNPTIPNHVRYVQPRDPVISQGNSILSLIELGRAKGYQPAYVTETNLIAVREDVFAKLGITDNSLETLRDDRPLMTCLFQGFDGTLLLDGPQELFWQHLPIDSERIQLVPKFLRRYPASLPREMRALRAVWVAWYLARRREFWPYLKDKIVRGVTKTPPPPRNF